MDVHPTTTPPAWVTAHAYVVDDQVSQSGDNFRCLIAHTSGTFATDLAAGKWEEIFRLNQSGPLELATPYLESELRDIQYCQVNDLMYLTHPDHEPWKLTRQAVDNWTIGPIAWEWPPTLEENVEDVTLKPSATTGNITLTASAATFKAGHVGSYWQIGHRRGDSSVEIALTNADATSAQSLRARQLGVHHLRKLEGDGLYRANSSRQDFLGDPAHLRKLSAGTAQRLDDGAGKTLRRS